MHVKYDAKVSAAPVVIAKGQDFIALRIKEVAKENKVEIVENKPLARTLYETVEIGKAIPPELISGSCRNTGICIQPERITTRQVR